MIILVQFGALIFSALQGKITAHAPVAQGIEQRTSNPLAGGSNPPRRTKNMPQTKGLRLFIFIAKSF